jgi:hypothetical protein
MTVQTHPAAVGRVIGGLLDDLSGDLTDSG